MDIDAFVARNQGDWQRLDALARAARKPRNLPAGDLDELLARYPAGASAHRLLRLRLRGSLPREGLERLASFDAELKTRVLHYEPDYAGVRLMLTAADIDREFARGGFAHRLLTALAANDSDREALQAAFELLGEGR